MSNSNCFAFRCINCSIKIPVKNTNSLASSKVSRALKTLSQYAINILKVWIQPAMLSPDDILCLECFKLLHMLPESNNSDSIPKRKFGHRDVCIGCGKSVLRKRFTKMPSEGPLREIFLNLIPAQLRNEVSNPMSICYACTHKARRMLEERDINRKISQPFMAKIRNNYINDVCRTCLATGADKSVYNILCEFENLNIFLYCLGVTIDPFETADQMPLRSLCSQCYDLLKEFHKFKSKALRIDSYFKSLNKIEIQKGVNTVNTKDSRKSRKRNLSPKLKEFSVISDSDEDLNKSSDTEHKTLLSIKQEQEVEEMLVEDAVEIPILEAIADHTYYDSNINEEYMETQYLDEEYEQVFDSSMVENEIKIEHEDYLKTVPDNNVCVPATEIKDKEIKIKDNGVIKKARTHVREDEEDPDYDPDTPFHLQNAHLVKNKPNKTRFLWYKTNKDEEDSDYEPDSPDVETKVLRRTVRIPENTEPAHPERSCLQCRIEFKSVYIKRKHDNRIHFGGNRYFCEICNKTVKWKSTHNTTVHGITMYPFKCKKCKRNFMHEANYLEHKASHTPDSSFPCPVCKETRTNFEEYKKHKAEAHPKDHKSIEKRRKKHMCHICSAQVNSRTRLEAHVRARHTKEKPYKCDICGKGFSCTQGLKNHVLIHGDRAFKCDVCSKGFKSRSVLHKHRTHVHSQVRKYSCQLCDVKFKTKDAKKQHEMNVHKMEVSTKKDLDIETSES